jgi:hypothetical protein
MVIFDQIFCFGRFNLSVNIILTKDIDWNSKKKGLTVQI